MAWIIFQSALQLLCKLLTCEQSMSFCLAILSKRLILQLQSLVSAEGAKDARDASESELRKSRINLFCLQKIEFNFHNVCTGKWLVT